MKNKVNFCYGVLCDSLEKQANKQGFTLGESAEKYEKIKDAINMCAFHVATDSQVTQMVKKLHKNVIERLDILK